MARPSSGLAVLAFVLAVGVCAWPRSAGRVAAEEDARPKAAELKADPALTGSTIAALLDANGGKPPATGAELVKALDKIGKFVQLPVVFSQVRLDSGLGNPRVVITPLINGLGDAGPTEPSLNGRLFFAANMERDPKGGEPRVTSVEFISWNVLRRKFDFGVIENMGGEEAPELRVVDGGRCFACHKNRGPILNPAPWSNTTDFVVLRELVAQKFKLGEPAPGGAGEKRERIDGMALASPAAPMVDAVVRVGALLELNRDTFRLMTKSAGGRKALVAMLIAITEPERLDANNRQAKLVTDRWGSEQSYIRFAADWVALAKTTNTGVLLDFPPYPTSKTRLPGSAYYPARLEPLPTPPPGGFKSPGQAFAFEAKLKAVKENNDTILKFLTEQAELIAKYDDARAKGKHGVPSVYQPSNPKAFIQFPTRARQKPSEMVNPVMLANTIGLTEGDRRFMSDALQDAAEKLAKQKVTTAMLARQVFDGPEFADVLAGGPLPDRDDFKDRFVAGLHGLLITKYKFVAGFKPERKTYASAPRRDPKLVDEVEAAVAPTSACLRCHDVRPSGKSRVFEPIPPLYFDPFDKQGRADWVRANPKTKQEVLARLAERLFADADMPPSDSPEHGAFRVKQAAAFDDLKRFLAAEFEPAKKP